MGTSEGELYPAADIDYLLNEIKASAFDEFIQKYGKQINCLLSEKLVRQLKYIKKILQN